VLYKDFIKEEEKSFITLANKIELIYVSQSNRKHEILPTVVQPVLLMFKSWVTTTKDLWVCPMSCHIKSAIVIFIYANECLYKSQLISFAVSAYHRQSNF
jgi:hypothetical protein